MIKQTSRNNCPFRSITDLKNYEDNETIKGPSLTDTSQYVPLDIMIKSMTTQEYNWRKMHSLYVSDEEIEKDGLLGIDEITDLTDLTTQYEISTPELAERSGAGDGVETAVESSKPLVNTTRINNSTDVSTDDATNVATSPTIGEGSLPASTSVEH